MSSTTVTRAVTKMVRSYFPKPEKRFPIVEQKVQFGPTDYVIGGRPISPFAARSINFTYSRTMLGKRPGSPGEPSRPSKCQATSSQEEGESDDDPSLAFPPPPPPQAQPHQQSVPRALNFS
ncbi:hypothetical protein M422DRAFT_259422 [Sphaerobolus stellatus SS14]|uniref:Unplaced genomic scaffold SPHSTscaffold_89, whole genome shotgun sequence n=1 Tax=Sphaerobolus stellatus (strain SS14) TaxID=990650 RepID=A0A0C9V8Z3_SPHS4|nr:hypothetical protein M422DRAFT_259422 [Sphaerobolus stellatus SS14]